MGSLLFDSLNNIKQEVSRLESERQLWEQEKISMQLKINLLEAENQKLRSVQTHLHQRIEQLENRAKNSLDETETTDVEGVKDQLSELNISEGSKSLNNFVIYNEKLKSLSDKLMKIIVSNKQPAIKITTPHENDHNHQSSLPITINNDSQTETREVSIAHNNNNDNNNNNNNNNSNVTHNNIGGEERSDDNITTKICEISCKDESNEHSSNIIISESRNDDHHQQQKQQTDDQISVLEKSKSPKEDDNTIVIGSENNNGKEDLHDGEHIHRGGHHNDDVQTDNNEVASTKEQQHNDNNNNSAPTSKNEIINDIDHHHNEESSKCNDDNDHSNSDHQSDHKEEEEIKKEDNSDKMDAEEKNNASSPSPYDEYLNIMKFPKLDDITKKPQFNNWKPVSTIRAHFDAIRTANFHPEFPILLTGSDDMTLKLWSIKTYNESSKINVDDFHTCYGHKKAVLSSVFMNDGSCFSGGLDGAIIQWQFPEQIMRKPEPFAELGVGMSYFVKEYHHSDAVWDLVVNPSGTLLFSASSDSSVKIISIQNQKEMMQLFHPNNENGVNSSSFIPTSLSSISNNDNHVIVGYNNCDLNLIDVENGTVISKLQDSEMQDYPENQINKIVCHPTFPLVFVGYEDKHIRYFDVRSGECIYSMVAHQDSISTLTIDPNGNYLFSGGHDSSLRVWDILQKSCVQEIQANRKKFDEAILASALHPLLNLGVSSGADSTLKFIKRV